MAGRLRPGPDVVAASAQSYLADLSWWQTKGLPACEHSNRVAATLGYEPLDCGTAEPQRERYLPPDPDLARDGTGYQHLLGVPVALGGLLLGASLVTAEFGAGVMGLWLTVVAPRSRVVSTKVVAGATGGALVGLVAARLGVGGVLVAFAAHGHAEGGAGDSALVAGRLLVLGALAGAAGASLGLALRHVAVVLGVVAWWTVAVEYVAPDVWSRAAPVGLVLSARAWLEGRAVYEVNTCASTALGTRDCTTVEHVVGAAQGGSVLLAAVALLVAVALFIFRRRDVV